MQTLTSKLRLQVAY